MDQNSKSPVRLDITRATVARQGDLVRITVALKRNLGMARVSVWSKVGDFDFSPMTPMDYVTLTGVPHMCPPLYVRLNGTKKNHVFEFTCPETMTIIVRQEADSADEPITKAKVKCYGKFNTTIRRALRNFKRRLGG